MHETWELMVEVGFKSPPGNAAEGAVAPVHTVIMVQAENEPEVWGSIRDYSSPKIFWVRLQLPAGEKAAPNHE
jgi:hypothetical protein